MKSRKNSLRYKIWLYLIIFSFSILIFLWLFQVIFLDSYYRWYKTRELISTAEELGSKFSSDNYEEVLDKIAHDSGVCVELVQNGKLVYLSNTFNRGCLAATKDTYN